MTTTVYVSIGNSDDKLTQSEWALFFSSTAILLQRHAKVYGQWCSEPASAWQNACWCVEIASKDEAEYIKAELVGLAQQFRQDSIKWDVCATPEFLHSVLACRRAHGGSPCWPPRDEVPA